MLDLMNKLQLSFSYLLFISEQKGSDNHIH